MTKKILCGWGMEFYFSANEDYGVLRILKMNVAKAGYETLPRILELKV